MESTSPTSRPNKAPEAIARLSIMSSSPYLTTDERACAGEGASTGLETSVPEVPSVNHVWPNLQSDGRIGDARGRGETRGVVEQGLRRSDLDQSRRQAFQVREERRDTRVPSVHSGGNISNGEFAEVALVDEGIDGIRGAARSRSVRASALLASRHNPEGVSERPARGASPT